MSDNQEQPEEIEIKSVEDFAENVASISQEEYANIRQRALDEAKTRKHSWVQKGAYLCCNSCTFPHRTLIGTDKSLKGIDKNNNPIIEKRVLQQG